MNDNNYRTRLGQVFYDQGWNDFLDGKEWPGSDHATIDYRDGWHDAREAYLEGYALDYIYTSKEQ
jgi:hypothetical protein